jgi:hypothetical protein
MIRRSSARSSRPGVWVHCDAARCRFKHFTPASYSNGGAVTSAIRRGWTVDDARHLCPRCSCVPCHDCGGLIHPGGHSDAAREHTWRHHESLVDVTRAALDGLAPIPPAQRTAFPHGLRFRPYAMVAVVDRGRWGPTPCDSITFAPIENAEELAGEHEALAMTAAAARLVRDTGYPWWHAWSLVHGVDPDIAARRGEFRNGEPCPDLLF